MSAPSQPAPSSSRKPLASFVKLSRDPAESHLRSAVMSPTGLVHAPLQAFESSDIWPWIKNWFKATYQTDIESLSVPTDKKHSFDPYPATGERGHYDLAPLLAADGSIRIGLAGDWGTGTDVAQQISDNIKAADPELTIHLGDVYYVGEGDEVKQNCLGMDTTNFKGVFWRNGSKGSFALNGNHEMYSGGNGYFGDFLPTLGIPTTEDKQQLRSYFCLETPKWRILAIDTGYNSDTITGDCHLEPALMDWLKNKIDPLNSRKPTVLLSHHQWFSGFADGNYDKPAEQVAPLFKNQEIVWLWGHEHRLAIYNKFKGTGDLTAYGRCIGHGGMPIEMPGVPIPIGNSIPQQVEYWDGETDVYPGRFHKLGDTQVGTNGYAQMTIQDSTLTIEYLDADGKTSVLKESFVPGGGASWDGTLVRSIVNDPKILTHIFYETAKK
jgi:hypothetical protein